MNVNQGTVGSDPVILATAGYDHTVRFWQAHSGICTRTVQHQDSVSLPQRRICAAMLKVYEIVVIWNRDLLLKIIK